ncbi:hypothetical protein CASFOL_037032 [Castilleja foliolosa]|uniref:RING-type E3 ubiquitin transferase n=1 Tax=Castilleja foliolosa TaxID=1961234 RepID=A0ABD3BQB6_9LAMI
MAISPLPPSPPPSTTYAYPPIIIILTIILLIFFFFGFFVIYFCRCFMESIICTWHLRHNTSGAPATIGGSISSSAQPVGLDPLIVNSFPTFTYSTVKEYRKEKYGLECAICLIEFQGIDVLRLLTSCYHVFHKECIDLWLESHKTCPACRRNLDSPARSPRKSPSLADNEMVDSVSITIKDENEDDHESVRSSEKDKRACSSNNNDDEKEGEESKVEKFLRSHSTGHSLIRDKEIEEDRFKLILPEHVKSDIIRAHHNPSQSCPSFGEIKADQSDTRNTNAPAKAEAEALSGGQNRV